MHPPQCCPAPARLPSSPGPPCLPARPPALQGKILKTRMTRQFAHTWRHFATWVPFVSVGPWMASLASPVPCVCSACAMEVH